MLILGGIEESAKLRAADLRSDIGNGLQQRLHIQSGRNNSSGFIQQLKNARFFT
jgi:hypothetical protein